MTEVRSQENAIVSAAINQLVSQGSLAAQRLLNGKEYKKQMESMKSIVRIFNAYNCKTDLTDAEIDSLLYCLKYLSGASYFPTVSPIVGQSITIIKTVAPTGTWIEQGNWDGSTNLFPSVGKLGDYVKAGYTWNNTNDTTTLFGADGGIIPAGVTIVAKIDSPGQSVANWRIFY